MSAIVQGMKFLVFLGSARNSTPPHPARLGLRVAAMCCRLLSARDHAVQLVDPLDLEASPVFKPHFAYKQDSAPPGLDDLAQAITGADGYVMVSPEYNHAMSPALAHLLNHFGASRFAWKPSAIVTYSAGQWGGARAAMGLRGFLSELGCLPVSAMVHLPKAHEALDQHGAWADNAEKWDGYVGRTFSQLEWWAEAARRQRGQTSAPTAAFVRDPSQRNAP